MGARIWMLRNAAGSSCALRAASYAQTSVDSAAISSSGTRRPETMRERKRPAGARAAKGGVQLSWVGVQRDGVGWGW